MGTGDGVICPPWVSSLLPSGSLLPSVGGQGEKGFRRRRSG